MQNFWPDKKIVQPVVLPAPLLELRELPRAGRILVVVINLTKGERSVNLATPSCWCSAVVINFTVNQPAGRERFVNLVTNKLHCEPACRKREVCELTKTFMLRYCCGDRLQNDGTLVKQSPVVEDVRIGQLVVIILLPKVRVQHSE